MTPDQFRRVRALFEELRGLPAGEWAARLEAACPDDPAVRQEVLDLLQQAAADFAAQRTAPSGGPPAESPPAADPLLGTSIGPYRIRGVLGQGGMGSVYEAEHERTKQVVALKLIRSGLATPALLRRFEFELQVLARLEHPGIARIYHADTADIGGGPQPYFAMELVRGQNLIQYATEQKLTIRQRLELAAKIADAVQYAHQQGVIHRDLKPGNIFVTSAGQPKILDFGVARATDSDVQSTTLQTDIGQLIGTLPYMSPEQTAGDPNQIDTRSDVYALGVVIYELLTGRLPYLLERRLIHEVVRIIKEEEPTRLSSLNRTLRGDVETIVGKALEKEKERRYASANALAADIRRYLNDEPIAARPPSATYQIGKFARRNKVLVGGVAALLLLLVGALLVTVAVAQRETRLRVRAENAELQLQERERTLVDRLEAHRRAMMEHLNVVRAMPIDGEGLRAAERAYRLFHESGLKDPMMHMWAAEELGRKRYGLRQVREAAAVWQEAVSVARAEGQIETEHGITLLNNLAQCLAQTNQHDQAIDVYEELIPIRRRAGRGAGSAFATNLNNLGRMLYSRGEFSRAEPHLREALAVYRAAHAEPHADIANASWKYAAVLRALGRLQEADELLEQTLRRVPEEADKARLYGTIQQLADAYQAAADADTNGASRSRAEHWKRVLTESAVAPIAP